MIRVHPASIPRVLFYSPAIDVVAAATGKAVSSSADLIIGNEVPVDVVPTGRDLVPVLAIEDANLVSSYVSRIDDIRRIHDLHAPVIDVDSGDPEVLIADLIGWLEHNVHISAMRSDFYVVPSTTPGHFHLYVELALTWDKYIAMLSWLDSRTWVEHHYVRASIKHGATFVRPPGHRKPIAPRNWVPETGPDVDPRSV